MSCVDHQRRARSGSAPTAASRLLARRVVGIDPGARARARERIASVCGSEGLVALAYDADADGISSAALASAALERLGGSVLALSPPKGTNVYDDDFRRALAKPAPRLVMVVDTGSRPGVRWRDAPTVIVDHHVAAEPPDVEAFVHDEGAVATSMLVFDLLSPMVPIADRSWLAAVGALGDRGDDARALTMVQEAASKFGITNLREVVALVNASGRAASPAPEVALSALREADDPRTIARGEGTAARRLVAMRAEVSAATRRARRAAPRLRGRWAIIELDEPCRVHGVVASAWLRRLAPRIVLVANKGYTKGRVHVVVRSAEPLDLRAALRALLPDQGLDYAAGHARATGAIVDAPTYARLLAAIDAEAAQGASLT